MVIPPILIKGKINTKQGLPVIELTDEIDKSEDRGYNQCVYCGKFHRYY